MACEIAPTITAVNQHQYREQMERISSFASRVHIDLADGGFAPTQLVELEHIWWPEHLRADIHLMYQQPQKHLDRLVELEPSLVILHSEIESELTHDIRELKGAGLNVGLALLADTQPEEQANLIEMVSHVLIFSGKLGYHGGVADLSQLSKVERIKKINKNAEISWDGGINSENAGQLSQGGINVLNTGGYIQKAQDPEGNYKRIIKAINETK